MKIQRKLNLMLICLNPVENRFLKLICHLIKDDLMINDEICHKITLHLKLILPH